MKTMKQNYLWMMSLMLMFSLGLTSCVMDPDEGIGYDISGHWFGDLDMYYGYEKAIGSEIEFRPTGWGHTRGTGVEVDYYRFGTETHFFSWTVRNGVIYMLFDDHNLDCAIVDYRLGYTNFTGCIADYYTLQNQTYFNLRSYDRYWDTYGYGYGYGPYLAKGRKADTDSIATDTLAVEETLTDTLSAQAVPAGYSIRGVNRGTAYGE